MISLGSSPGPPQRAQRVGQAQGHALGHRAHQVVSVVLLAQSGERRSRVRRVRRPLPGEIGQERQAARAGRRRLDERGLEAGTVEPEQASRTHSVASVQLSVQARGSQPPVESQNAAASPAGRSRAAWCR